MTTLGVVEFGQALLTTGDLDPIYLMLEGAQLDHATLQRWCLAYWMFYHAGVASHLAEREGVDFWDEINLHLSGDDQFPRGTERRHFRGKAARKAVDYLADEFYNPTAAIGYLEHRALDWTNAGKPAPYTAIADAVQKWPAFGPWISFKVADMLDGLLGVPVDFQDGFPGNIFDDPAKGALWSLWVAEGSLLDAAGLQAEWEATNYRHVKTRLRDAFEDLRAKLYLERVPHRPDKKLRYQELETIFCKWKSHLRGHYPLGKDSKEILHGLAGWRHSPVARRCERELEELVRRNISDRRY